MGFDLDLMRNEVCLMVDPDVLHEIVGPVLSTLLEIEIPGVPDIYDVYCRGSDIEGVLLAIEGQPDWRAS